MHFLGFGQTATASAYGLEPASSGKGCSLRVHSKFVAGTRHAVWEDDVFALVVLAATAPASVSAATVAYNFSGTITSVIDNIGSIPIVAGSSTFVGQFSYDTNADPFSDDNFFVGSVGAIDVLSLPAGDSEQVVFNLNSSSGGPFSSEDLPLF